MAEGEGEVSVFDDTRKLADVIGLKLPPNLTDVELGIVLRTATARLEDVRDLDDWAKGQMMRFWDSGPTAKGDSFHCALYRADEDMQECFHESTPAAARHAAAEYVRKL